eukprot:TRINITY_DN2666_c4_g1_i1.p1 TRINITY_DN2666_c4_g1~~TRINITY_DN2666_c4_g1_i1.p1  ORF type:complete len:160 (+),score=34.75 TRINITY_DN2666_c4_g1_i1:36-515(+)
MNPSGSTNNTTTAAEDDEETFAIGTEVTEFDRAVGILEELVLCEQFMEVQNAFFKEHRSSFDDSEENKLCYTEIHSKFAEMMEQHVASKLEANGVNIADFLKEVREQDPDTLCGDMWELLLSLTDFTAFKELMLSVPLPGSEQSESLDLSLGPSVTSVK